MSDTIKSYETAVRNCFTDQHLDDEGIKIQYRDDTPNRMFIIIPDGIHWYKNCCILRDAYFNYELFNKLPLEIDCDNYGVFVVWETAK